MELQELGGNSSSEVRFECGGALRGYPLLLVFTKMAVCRPVVNHVSSARPRKHRREKTNLLRKQLIDSGAYPSRICGCRSIGGSYSRRRTSDGSVNFLPQLPPTLFPAFLQLYSFSFIYPNLPPHPLQVEELVGGKMASRRIELTTRETAPKNHSVSFALRNLFTNCTSFTSLGGSVKIAHFFDRLRTFGRR